MATMTHAARAEVELSVTSWLIVMPLAISETKIRGTIPKIVNLTQQFREGPHGEPRSFEKLGAPLASQVIDRTATATRKKMPMHGSNHSKAPKGLAYG